MTTERVYIATASQYHKFFSLPSAMHNWAPSLTQSESEVFIQFQGKSINNQALLMILSEEI